MKVAVVGMGLFGQSLARHLARQGIQVIAVDARMDLVDDIKDEVATAVCLDATDEKELRAQGIHEVDLLVASIGDDFEANQLLIMMAKKIGIPRVVARAPSLVHARILRLIGADEVVMPEEEAAKQLGFRLMQPSLKGYMALIEGVSVAEIEAPEAFQGKSLLDLDLKRHHHVSLVAIKRDDPDRPGRAVVNVVPMGSDVVTQGDVLLVIGRDRDIKTMLGMPVE